MNDMMKYKGYFGSVRYTDEDAVFHGKIEFIRGLVSYEGTDVASLREAFEEAVDDYLEMCEQEGITPEKPFKGSFNVRTGSELHQRAATYAQNEETTLNQLVVAALEQYLDGANRPRSHR